MVQEAQKLDSVNRAFGINWGKAATNKVLIGAVLALIAGGATFAAVKTWLGWNHTIRTDVYDGSVRFPDSIDGFERRGLTVGLPIWVSGLGGAAGGGIAYVALRNGKKVEFSERQKAAWVAGLVLCASLFAYGVAVQCLGEITHETLWRDPPFGTRITHWHLNRGFEALAGISATVLAVGGGLTVISLVTRWRLKAAQEKQIAQVIANEPISSAVNPEDHLVEVE